MEISPMFAILLKVWTRKYKENSAPEIEKVLRFVVLRCGMDPVEYIGKINRRGTMS